MRKGPEFGHSGDQRQRARRLTLPLPLQETGGSFCQGF